MAKIFFYFSFCFYTKEMKFTYFPSIRLGNVFPFRISADEVLHIFIKLFVYLRYSNQLYEYLTSFDQCECKTDGVFRDIRVLLTCIVVFAFQLTSNAYIHEVVLCICMAQVEFHGLSFLSYLPAGRHARYVCHLHVAGDSPSRGTSLAAHFRPVPFVSDIPESSDIYATFHFISSRSNILPSLTYPFIYSVREYHLAHLSLSAAFLTIQLTEQKTTFNFY